MWFYGNNTYIMLYYLSVKVLYDVYMMLSIQLRACCKPKSSVCYFQIQWTLVISKSKGPSETLCDIRSSTYISDF